MVTGASGVKRVLQICTPPVNNRVLTAASNYLSSNLLLSEVTILLLIPTCPGEILASNGGLLSENTLVKNACYGQRHAVATKESN